MKSEGVRDLLSNKADENENDKTRVEARLHSFVPPYATRKTAVGERQAARLAFPQPILDNPASRLVQ